MRNGLLLSLLFYSSILLAQTIFYPPSTYKCAPKGDECVCTQKESPYFPKYYTLLPPCDGMKPFLLSFMSVSVLIVNDQDYVAYPTVTYRGQNPFTFPIEIKGVVKASAATTWRKQEWYWEPQGYVCGLGNTPNDPYDCPLILQE